MENSEIEKNIKETKPEPGNALDYFTYFEGDGE